MLSTTGILSPTTSVELSVGRAHNSLDFIVQNEQLRRSAAGLSGMPLLFPDAVQDDYIPDFRFNGGRAGGNAGFYQTDRGPFTNQNTTWDALANLTKIWGSHSAKFGVYYQSSYKPQSVFASFNSQINFIDDANNPFDTGFPLRQRRHRRVQPVHAGFEVRPARVALQELRVVRSRTTGRPRSTPDPGLRRALLLHDAAVGHDPAGVQLPARPVRREPGRRASTGRSASAPLRARAPTGARWIRRSSTRAWRPPWGTRSTDRFVGRLVPGSNRFNGAFQAGQGIDDQPAGRQRLQACRPGSASPTTSRARARRSSAAAPASSTTGRRATMVFDMVANAPGVLVSTLQWGRLQDLTRRRTGDPEPDALAEPERASTSSRPRSTPGTSASSTS